MSHTNKLKKIAIALFILFSMINNNALANSAPIYVYREVGPGFNIAPVKSESIEVLHEDLSYDATEQADMAVVKAKYSMRNTTNESQKVTMAFPYVGGDMNSNNRKEHSYYKTNILIDGKGVEKKIKIIDRAALIERSGIHVYKGNDFIEMTSIQDLLNALEIKPQDRYTSKYINENEEFAVYSIIVPAKSKKNLLISFRKDQNFRGISFGITGGMENDKSVDSDKADGFVLYTCEVENYSDKEMKATVGFPNIPQCNIEKNSLKVLEEGKELSSRSMPLSNFLMENTNASPSEYSLSKEELMEAYYEFIDDRWSGMDFIDVSDIQNKLINDTSVEMIFFDVEFGPGSAHEVEVMFEQYAGLDYMKGAKDSGLKYLYFLEPAKYWKNFGDLDITIKTPLDSYIAENSLELHRSEDFATAIYKAHFNGLPEANLQFEVFIRQTNEAKGGSWNGNETVIIAFCILLTTFLLLVLLFIKGRAKGKEWWQNNKGL